jgi:hypothetical protein
MIEIQLVHRQTGKVVGYWAPWSIPTRAAYVVYLLGKWKEIANDFAR